MNILKGPRKSGKLTLTDSKSLAGSLEGWEPPNKIQFDGTKDKKGTRETRIAVQFSPDDIASLGAALYRFQIERIKELDDLRKKLLGKIGRLEKTLIQISKMIGDRAESNAELLFKKLKAVADQSRA